MRQVDIWSREDVEYQAELDPETERVQELTLQNRNLRLLSPIYRIEQNKGKVGTHSDRESPQQSLMETIDTVYLSILILEYYAAYALSRESIPADEVISYLQAKINVMNAMLDDEENRRIAAWIHDSLCNQADNYKAFNFSYFDSVKQTMHRYDFWLIKIEKVDKGNECKITEEGVSALLTYINANPKLQDEVTALLTQRLIKMGRYEDALEMAERSRKKVIQYQEKISSAADKVRRDAKAGKLSEVVLPLIIESSQHVKERIKEEDETLNSLSDIAYNKLDDATIKLVGKLKQAIHNNLLAYQKLYDHIEKTHQRFEQTFRSLLRLSTGTLPNMVNDLLQPMCHWQLQTLSKRADAIVDRTMPLKIPSLFDVVTLLDNLNSKGEREYHESAEEQEADMQKITRITPLFSGDMIDDCKRYYQYKLAEKRKITLQQLLKEANQEQLSLQFQRCLSYVIVMSFTDSQSVQGKKMGLSIRKQGRFNHYFITGDDLLIQMTKD